MKDLTRGAKKIVQNAITTTKTLNRYKLCEFIAYELEEKFKHSSFDYQTKRMKLETTGQILNAIDTYMYKYIDKTEVNDDEE